MKIFNSNRAGLAAVLSMIPLLTWSVAGKAASAHDNCTGPNSISKHIEIFDDLDFNVYTNQKWDELKKSHAEDILVHYPDGHTTKGLKEHIVELKKAFVFAPDTRITAHPVKFGAGDWTSVIGEMQATFSKPMPIGEGKTIPPTGKALKMQMATVAHWNKDCLMDEEYLFWDNANYARQFGIGP